MPLTLKVIRKRDALRRAAFGLPPRPPATPVVDELSVQRVMAPNVGVTLTADSQALADAANDQALVGKIAQWLLRFVLVGEFDRPGAVWFDKDGRFRAWFGWHDKNADGAVHRAVEVKTSVSLTDPFNPDELVTRDSIRTEDPADATSRYTRRILNWLSGVEFNWGHRRVDTPLSLLWRMPKDAAPATTNTATVAALSPQVAADGTILFPIDLGIGAAATQFGQNVNGHIRLFRDTDTGTHTAFLVVYKGDGTNTEAFKVNAKTGTAYALGQDGATLKKVILEDDPRLGSLATKAADQDALNTAALADVIDLTLPLAANTVYEIDADLIATGATAGDLALGWSLPAGATLDWVTGGPSTGVSAQSAAAANINALTGGSTGTVGMVTGSTVMFRSRGILRTGGTAGAVQLRFAQAAADNTLATTIKARSTLRTRRLA